MQPALWMTVRRACRGGALLMTAAVLGCSDPAASTSAGSDSGPGNDAAALSDADSAGSDSQTENCSAGPDIAAAKDWGSAPSLPATAACNSGLGWIPGKLPSLAYDDGEAKSSLPKQNWHIAGSYTMNDHPAWEAVRFDVEKPSRVWGFSIQWAVTPTDDSAQAAAELVAGLYPDFSNNGFDFYRWSPLWQGSRCQG
ncbi:MAG: hypothetical protein HY902_01645, partial [Deltaproteobacteria bacterium]|nr:hypothetical protein [Deltaproteobacteria bacterium]